MKKLVLFLGLSGFIFANTLPLDMVCKKVSKSEIETIMQTKFKEAKVGKLPFDPPYDISFCNYSNSVLPEVSLYYYYKGDASVYPPGSNVKELKNLKFPARAVFTKSGDIFELIADTKEGKLMFVFNNGIKNGSSQYKKSLELLEKLVKEFK